MEAFGIAPNTASELLVAAGDNAGGVRSEPTIAYVERRTAEGLSTREIIRCLKRYLARAVYHLLPKPTLSEGGSEPLGYIPPVQFEEEYYRQSAEEQAQEEEQALRTTESPMNPRRFKDSWA